MALLNETHANIQTNIQTHYQVNPCVCISVAKWTSMISLFPRFIRWIYITKNQACTQHNSDGAISGDTSNLTLVNCDSDWIHQQHGTRTHRKENRRRLTTCRVSQSCTCAHIRSGRLNKKWFIPIRVVCVKSRIYICLGISGTKKIHRLQSSPLKSIDVNWKHHQRSQ